MLKPLKIKKFRRQTKLRYQRSALMFLALIAGFIFAQHVFAQADEGLRQVGQVTGFFQQDPRLILAKIVRIALGFIGLIAIIIVLYGGFLWMTAKGNEEQVTKAKKVLTNGFIGLVIILMSYSFVSFIIGRLTGRGVGLPPSRQAEMGGYAGGALGGGIVESHYPPRNATGIPRNTKIIVTFKEAMKLDSIFNGNETPADITDDLLITDNVVIKRTADIDNPTIPGVAARVNYTDDHKTFVFTPLELLGSATDPMSYSVLLNSNVKKSIPTPDGSSAFGGLGSYGWQFEVSTIIDVTPPQLKSVFPRADATTPRNTIIQMNFNEAMDPISVSGSSPNFTNIEVRNRQGNLIAGVFNIANQYQSVEFRTNDLCGQNSCGGDVYCLPGDEDIRVTVKAATLDGEGPSSAFPYTGAADAAGNSFDGTKDGKADGPPTDNESWNFKTSAFIDLTPPVVEETRPQIYAEEVPVDADIGALFSKVLRLTTLNTTNVLFDGWPYWVSALAFDIKEDGVTTTQTAAVINHEDLDENTPYEPAVTSGIEDIFQNCFQPCDGPIVEVKLE